MSILTLKTAPASEPMTVAAVKTRLRVDTTADDTDIGQMITTAREYVEDIADHQCITATRLLILDEFWEGALEMPRPPLATVSSIKYFDIDGNEQTLSSAVYTVDTDSRPGRVYLAYGQDWPAVREISKAVTIEYTCGVADAADVPAGIVSAIHLLIGHLYENREAYSTIGLKEVPTAFKALVAQHKIQRV